MDSNNRSWKNKNQNFQPKYSTEFSENETFVNPYNFVAASPHSVSEGSLTNDDHITGYFECNVETKTPLAILDSYSRKSETVRNENHECVGKHYTYDFFSYDGVCTIPGSALRGAIRSVYETVTDSCMVTVRNGNITRRTSRTLQPGILVKNDDKWELYAATRYLLPIASYKPFNKDNIYPKIPDPENPEKNIPVIQKVSIIITNAEHLGSSKPDGQYRANALGNERFAANGNNNAIVLKRWNLEELKDTIGFGGKVRIATTDVALFKDDHEIGQFVIDIEPRNDELAVPGYKNGILFIGEAFSNKHFESVFVPQGLASDDQEKLTGAMSRLDQVHRMYNDNSVNVKKTKTMYPDYGTAKAKGLIPIWYTISMDGSILLSLASIGRIVYGKSIYDMLGQKKPCHDRNSVCKACALFGMAVNGGYDNKGVGSKVRVSDAIPKGKVSLYKDGQYITLHELAEPTISYMPFYITLPKDEENTWSFDNPTVELRGRKYYWHHQFKETAEEKTVRNHSVQMVDKGNTFGFRVYFDDISKEQLDELKWVITLGGNNTNCGHKIGNGKPLGLGSVKITIEKEWIRCTSDGYRLIEQEPVISDIPADSRVKAEILKITDFDVMKEQTVDYPGIINKTGSYFKPNDNRIAMHRWYSRNYGRGKKPPRNTLADVLDDNQTLPMAEITEKQS